VVFNTKEFHIMAASIGSDFHVFKLVLKLIFTNIPEQFFAIPKMVLIQNKCKYSFH
jgi:hypothetical protein